MRDQQITTADARALNVVDFVPVDDKIPLVTGITLIDCDAKVIARRLRSVGWPKRAFFFRNIVHDSLENAVAMMEHAKDEKTKASFLAWAPHGDTTAHRRDA